MDWLYFGYLLLTDTRAKKAACEQYPINGNFQFKDFNHARCKYI